MKLWLFLVFMIAGQNVWAQTTRLYLHANPNPKFASIVNASPGYLLPAVCRSGTTNKILYRSLNQTAGTGSFATLGFAMGTGVSGGAGTIGCQMQNGSEFLFWITPALASNYTMNFSGAAPLNFNIWCQLTSAVSLSISFYVLKYDGKKDAITSSTEIFMGTYTTTCGTTPTNIIPNYTTVNSVTLNKGDRLIIAPFIVKSGGGGAASSTINMLVDAPSGTGFSYIDFPGTVPFETVDDGSVARRPVRVN